MYMHILLLSFFFLKSVRSVLPTDYIKSLFDRKVSNVQTRKAQFNLFSLPNLSCSASRNSSHCGGANQINCLLETCLGAVDFSMRNKGKTKKYMQQVVAKDQIRNTIFQSGWSSCAVTLFGSSFHFLEGPTSCCYLYFISTCLYSCFSVIFCKCVVL